MLLLAHGCRVSLLLLMLLLLLLLLVLLLLLHHLSALGIVHSGVSHSRSHTRMKHALLVTIWPVHSGPSHSLLIRRHHTLGIRSSLTSHRHRSWRHPHRPDHAVLLRRSHAHWPVRTRLPPLLLLLLLLLLIPLLR